MPPDEEIIVDPRWFGEGDERLLMRRMEESLKQPDPHRWKLLFAAGLILAGLIACVASGYARGDEPLTAAEDRLVERIFPRLAERVDKRVEGTITAAPFLRRVADLVIGLIREWVSEKVAEFTRQVLEAVEQNGERLAWEAAGKLWWRYGVWGAGGGLLCVFALGYAGARLGRRS